MNKIRINNEEEVIKTKAKFALPTITYVIYIILAIGCLITFIISFVMKDNLVVINGKTHEVVFPTYILLISFSVILLIIFTTIFLLRLFGLKKAEFCVTNKRIYGKNGIIIVHKSFSYRLDEINNIEHKNSLGNKILVIHFEQGKGPNSVAPIAYRGMITNMGGSGVLTFKCVKNAEEVYEVLNGMLTSTKNQFDTKVDIEMKKIDTEKRKADAIESIADNIHVAGAAAISSGKKTSKRSYITELKDLKKLLDEGVITKEEFDQEKKEILDKCK